MAEPTAEQLRLAATFLLTDANRFTADDHTRRRALLTVAQWLEELLPHGAGQMMVRECRPFPPLKPDHPTIGEKCTACQVPFHIGDITTLVIIGPGIDPENRRKAREGQAYTGVAAHVHYACATGVEDGDG